MVPSNESTLVQNYRKPIFCTVILQRIWTKDHKCHSITTAIYCSFQFELYFCKVIIMYYVILQIIEHSSEVR